MDTTSLFSIGGRVTVNDRSAIIVEEPRLGFRRFQFVEHVDGEEDFGIASVSKLHPTPQPAPKVSEPFTSSVSENSEAGQIPDFDPSVITGIYAKFVELITRGTTLAPQFAYAIAKMVVGLKMAGKTKFATLDVEPRYQIAAIGETGTGKGEAFHRTLQVLQPEGAIGNICGFKIVDSIDSGAGLKDLFFSPPEDQAVLCYIDEIKSLGNKSNANKNPDILDTIMELADKTLVSRVLAKRETKTKRDARLATYICGQNGPVYAAALTGRTELGATDRLYPEFGVPVETGDLPAVDTLDAIKLITELNSLNYVGTIEMSPDAKVQLDSFWNAQPPNIRKKARWKKALVLDAYMQAFGAGRWIVETEDAAIAIKICTRQLIIRKVCFKSEVPDRIGYYISLLKAITERMEERLLAGAPPETVARSRRDFETDTNAFRDNELHVFGRSWDSFARTYLQAVEIKKANGQKYIKYLPAQKD